MPWGLPNLSHRNAALVQAHSFMMKSTFRIMEAMHTVGGLQTFEHPEDPGRDPFPSVWDTSEYKSIQRRCSLSRQNFSQGAFGAQAYKGTDVAGSPGLKLSLLDRQAKRRDFKAVIGVDPLTNDWKTRSLQEYPTEMCRALAMIHLEGLLAREPLEHRPEAMDPRTLLMVKRDVDFEVGEKLPIPPIALHWSDIRRWREVYRWDFEKEEHINVLELKAAYNAIRHKSRRARSWHKRHLIFVDNQVILGALAKGRSSRQGLNYVLRKVASLTLGLRMRVYPRWVPTKRNYADGPSRGFSLGVAPESIPTRCRPSTSAEKFFKKASG